MTRATEEGEVRGTRAKNRPLDGVSLSGLSGAEDSHPYFHLSQASHVHGSTGEEKEGRKVVSVYRPSEQIPFFFFLFVFAYLGVNVGE